MKTGLKREKKCLKNIVCIENQIFFVSSSVFLQSNFEGSGMFYQPKLFGMVRAWKLLFPVEFFQALEVKFTLECYLLCFSTNRMMSSQIAYLRKKKLKYKNKHRATGTFWQIFILKNNSF